MLSAAALCTAIGEISPNHLAASAQSSIYGDNGVEIQSTPTITFLTHGLSNDASTWSNDFKMEGGVITHEATQFQIEDYSLISKIGSYFDDEYQVIKITNKNGLILSKETDGKNGEKRSEGIDDIKFFPKHTIIVPELNTDLCLEDIYYDFEAIVQKVEADYKSVTNAYSRINFIGHSMGGLINMQYAIRHPEFVSSLISLGTPYNGSTYDNGFVSDVIGIQAFKEQPCICGKCGHDWFFCDPESRRTSWNEMYGKNRHIKFLACTGETSVDLIEKLADNQEFGRYNPTIPWAQTVADFLYGLSGVFSGDFCVDYDSQGAPGFDGAVRFNKKFDAANSHIEHRSISHLGVPHNLETSDPDLHKVILSTLGYEKNPEHVYHSSNGIDIQYVGLSESEWGCFYPDACVMKITNRTNKPRTFTYNSKLCFEDDASEWMSHRIGLGDLKSTGVLNPGESAIISAESNYLADCFAVSYADNNQRRVCYAKGIRLNDTSLNMTGCDATMPNNPYNCDYGIGLNLVSKYGISPFATWFVELTNNTASDRYFFFNKYLCFKDDGLYWNDIYDVEQIYLKAGETQVLAVSENGFAGSIAVSYVSGNYRYIVCSNELDTDRTLNPESYAKEVAVKIEPISFSSDDDEWTIRLTNNTGSKQTFYYNKKLCFKDDAKTWENLEDVGKVELNNLSSTLLYIEENVMGGTVAVSYIDFNTNMRHVAYGNELNKLDIGSIDTYSSYVPFQWYKQSNIGVSVGICGNDHNTWHLQVKNTRTDSDNTKFYYFSNTTDKSNALAWNDIGNTIKNVDIPRGESKPITIYEGSEDYIAVSYVRGTTRYVFYADDLDEDGTMSVQGEARDESLRAVITGKYNGYWNISFTNNSNSRKTFYYNTKMCNYDDAKAWKNLKDVDYFTIDKGVTRKVLIETNVFADSIAFCYIENFVRHIFYAKDLNEKGGMQYDYATKSMSTYSAINLKVGVAGKKNGNTWLFVVSNQGSARTYDYFPNMCDEAIAQGWNYLGSGNASKSLYLGSYQTLETPIEIKENGTNGYISFSYKTGNYRYIFYANGLSTACTMNSPATFNRDESIKVEITGKSSGTWSIRLQNNTGAARTFYYNKKMCFENHAKSFTTNLTDVTYVKLSNGESKIIYISENVGGGYIAISYIVGTTRYIFAANHLDTDGGMTGYRSTVAANSKTLNGMRVTVGGIDGDDYLLEFNNQTGAGQTFYYNRKTSFEGAARDWDGLKDVNSFYLASGATTTDPIIITENGLAETISFSYIDSSNYRRIFFAYDVYKPQMIAGSNNINLNQSSNDDSNCITVGTMITLADGTQKAVEDLTGDEMLLVWNLETGSYDVAPILFIDSDQESAYEVIALTFSDGTTVNVVSEHGFFDADLNKYVYLDKNAADYIGHRFVKQCGENYETVVLTDVNIDIVNTTTYSPVTYNHLCYYVNGMLSMPGGITGLFNYFDIDPETMKYDEEAMANDIETYGLLTYEELCEFAPVSYEMFEAVNGQYLKVALGKGLMTFEDIQYLAERYSSFVPGDEEEVEYTDEYIRNYILDAFEQSGTSLENVIKQYIRTLSGNYFAKIPHSVFEKAVWEVSYDGANFCAKVTVKWHEFNYIFNIKVA